MRSLPSRPHFACHMPDARPLAMNSTSGLSGASRVFSPAISGKRASTVPSVRTRLTVSSSWKVISSQNSDR